MRPIAKITRPKLSAPLERKRLFKLLDSAKGKPVAYLSAPAGSGKTTLVASWLDARAGKKPAPTIWYQVDEGDGDISSFFYYMGIAAKKAAPRYKKPLLLLTPEYLAGIPTFTRRYFEELYGRLTRKGARSLTNIVLDNYQDAPQDSPFHDMIVNGLDCIPHDIQVIVISRNELPPQFARLLANNKITRIGWEEIKFNLEETGEFIKAEGFKETTRQLHKQTDGWVADMVLMLEGVMAGRLSPNVSIGDVPAQNGRIQDSPLQNRETIFNYFATEIFNKTDKSTQDFLLKTAFLPDMTADMAQRLTGEVHAAQILAGLNRNNFFCQRQTAQNPTYRYHPLFQIFLQNYAKNSFTHEELNQIRQSAAGILAESGLPEEAARLLQDAKDFEGLIKLILTHAQAFAIKGRSKTLEAWIIGIPPDILDKTPWLLYWLGVCRLAYNPAGARGCFEKAYALFKREHDATGLLASCTGVMDSYIMEWGDYTPLGRWIQELENLLKHHIGFPSKEMENQGTITMFHSLMFHMPQHPDIALWEGHIQGVMKKSADNNEKLRCGHMLLLYYSWIGKSSEMLNLIRLLNPIKNRVDVTPMTRIMWQLIMGNYGWITANFEDCDNAITKGLRIGKGSGIHIMDAMLFAQMVFKSLLIGDMEAASLNLKQMESAINIINKIDTGHYHYLSAYYDCCRGEFRGAVCHAQTSLDLVVKPGFVFAQAISLQMLAYALFLSGEPLKKFAPYLKEALAIGHSMKSIYMEFNCSALEALFLLSSEYPKLRADGRKALTASMQLGVKHNIINLQGWRREDMAYICAHALDAGIEQEYVKNIIRKFKLTPPANAESIPHLENWPYPIKIYTLGKFEILINGKPLESSGKVQKKPLEMLKAIIALGGAAPVPVEKIADKLWPDAEGDMAHQSFKFTVHRLRKLLGNEKAVRVQDGNVTLDMRYCWVDAWAEKRQGRQKILQSRNE